jgi:hypothetical protein
MTWKQKKKALATSAKALSWEKMVQCCHVMRDKKIEVSIFIH